jgi:hypothetical protein
MTTESGIPSRFRFGYPLGAIRESPLGPIWAVGDATRM